MVKLNVNGQDQEVDAEPRTPLLYVLRDDSNSTLQSSAAGLANAAPAPSW
jgi:aerobic-type carbon monoxide dehydrogenase small subunit (CoxS/CutS family)